MRSTQSPCIFVSTFVPFLYFTPFPLDIPVKSAIIACKVSQHLAAGRKPDIQTAGTDCLTNGCNRESGARTLSDAQTKLIFDLAAFACGFLRPPVFRFAASTQYLTPSFPAGSFIFQTQGHRLNFSLDTPCSACYNAFSGTNQYLQTEKV